jgi:L-lactate dehydrogenase complex protein LldG
MPTNEMKVSAAKENILKRIRQALTHSTPLPFPGSEGNSPVYLQPGEDPAIAFAERFSKLQGKFVFCADTSELVAGLRSLAAARKWTRIFCREDSIRAMLHKDGPELITSNALDTCEAAITSCEALIARTGSILLSAAQQSGRTVSVYAPIHICIASSKQLVPDIRDGLQLIKEKYADHLPSLITLATGPSRTADIEKTLVVGVHGPREVYVFLTDSLDPS